MAEKSSWDQANIRQKLGLAWRNRKKISQISKDYFYLPLFLLIILWFSASLQCTYLQRHNVRRNSTHLVKKHLLAKQLIPYFVKTLVYKPVGVKRGGGKEGRGVQMKLPLCFTQTFQLCNFLLQLYKDNAAQSKQFYRKFHHPPHPHPLLGL